MPGTGHTSTIAFGTTGFTGNYHSISGPEQTVEPINDSHLGTTNYETYIPGDLSEPGQVECEIEYDPDDPPPLNRTAETITITYPTPSGLSNGATLAGTGFLVSRGLPTLQKNTLMTCRFVIQLDGKTEPTFTDAS